MSYRIDGLAADVFRTLGAAVTVLPGGEIVPVMDRGLLEGAAFNNPSSDLQLGLPSVAKVYMMGSHHRPAGAIELVFNKARHDAQPAEIKSILRHAALAASTTQLGIAYARYPKDLDEIGKRGVEVVRTGEAMLRAQLAAWDKVIAEHAKEPFFAKVIASQKAWVRRDAALSGRQQLEFGRARGGVSAFSWFASSGNGNDRRTAVLFGYVRCSVRGQEFRGGSEFPFDGELILDVRPMPGSKRIPNMDIAADGKVALEMWCNRVDGQVVVAGDTITVMTGTPTERACPPERAGAMRSLSKR